MSTGGISGRIKTSRKEERKGRCRIDVGFCVSVMSSTWRMISGRGRRSFVRLAGRGFIYFGARACVCGGVG